MSQSMLEERDLGQLSDADVGSLLERSLENDFQRHNNEAFNCLSHTKSRVSERKGPSYRKIDRYFKSRRQYKKERERRKQVLHYYLVEYRTQQYIADKLGVSRSTIKRDLAKLRGYIVRQNSRAIRLMQAEWSRERERRMEGLSLRERFDVLSEEVVRYRKSMNGRGYKGHYTILHLDLTKPGEYGIPKLTILPRQTRNTTLAYPHKVRVRVKGRYEDKLFEADLGGFNITQKTVW